MKEVIAIIRRHKLPETNVALKGAGFKSMTIQSVEGRGKQKGIGGWLGEIDPEMSDFKPHDPPPVQEPGMKYIPKRMITVVVEDSDVERIVEIIMSTNRSGHKGDGKIFVCPLGESIRIRTGEKGSASLVWPK